MYSLNM